MKHDRHGRPGSRSSARNPAAILRAPAHSSPYVIASGVSPSKSTESADGLDAACACHSNRFHKRPRHSGHSSSALVSRPGRGSRRRRDRRSLWARPQPQRADPGTSPPTEPRPAAAPPSASPSVAAVPHAPVSPAQRRARASCPASVHEFSGWDEAPETIRARVREVPFPGWRWRRSEKPYPWGGWLLQLPRKRRIGQSFIHDATRSAIQSGYR